MTLPSAQRPRVVVQKRIGGKSAVKTTNICLDFRCLCPVDNTAIPLLCSVRCTNRSNPQNFCRVLNPQWSACILTDLFFLPLAFRYKLSSLL